MRPLSSLTLSLLPVTAASRQSPSQPPNVPRKPVSSDNSWVDSRPLCGSLRPEVCTRFTSSSHCTQCSTCTRIGQLLKRHFVGVCAEPEALNVSAIAGPELLAALRAAQLQSVAGGSSSDDSSLPATLRSFFDALFSKDNLQRAQSKCNALQHITLLVFHSIDRELYCSEYRLRWNSRQKSVN